MPAWLRQHLVALRVLLMLTVVVGVLYPLLITGVAQVVAGDRANGSLVSRGGQVVGSRLIGQLFTDADGKPLPRYFQSRPSAAGKGYDPKASSASNLGPENKDLIKAVEERRAAAARLESVAGAKIPADALTASGSGLDPDISPQYAMLQVQRVARERGLATPVVQALVRGHESGRDLGFIGAPHVNVLELNLALDALGKA